MSAAVGVCECSHSSISLWRWVAMARAVGVLMNCVASLRSFS